MRFKIYSALLTLFTLNIATVSGERHVVRFTNKCGFGTPMLIVNGDVLSTGQSDYESDGPITAGIAYLQIDDDSSPGGKKCGFNGENCSLLELTMKDADPAQEGSGSSADISLIPPHAFSVTSGFSYWNGCDGQGANCDNPLCTTAFRNSNDNWVQVECQANDLRYLEFYICTFVRKNVTRRDPPWERDLRVRSLPNDGLVVSTAQGPVQGTFTGPDVRRFLGIPYATANRWETPKVPLPRSLSVPLDATKFSATCPQALTPSAIAVFEASGFDNSTILVPESEECLTVNIWTPSLNRKQNVAVLLWIYGGALQTGTSNFPTYNGTHIVQDNDDILVVTFNYRINIFGFPNSPQLSTNNKTSQNFGFLDHEAAIQWVHDNIRAFGGDPNRITLFGQSAGGISIDAYTFAHPEDTKIQGVIEQSGNLRTEFSVFPTPSNTSWNTVANAAGCTTVPNDAQINCMRKVPFRQLEDAVINTNSNFQPINDGITFFSNTLSRAKAGKFLRVPLLLGSTENEADVFIVGSEIASGNVVPNLGEVISDLSTLIEFTCPTGATALDRINAKVPTWRYDYQAVFHNISPRPDLRAYHGSELPILFGTLPSPTSAEKALSRFMQNAWVAFARDPVHGLVDIRWPQYSPNASTLAQIGGFYNETGATFGQGRLFDFACSDTEALSAALGQLLPLFGPAGTGL